MASFEWMLLTEPTYNRARLTRRLAGEDSEPEGTTQRITDLDDSRPREPAKPRARDDARLRRGTVANADNRGWSLYGAPWLQPVAISGKSRERGRAENKPKPLPPAATSCDGKEGVDGSSPSEGFAV